MADVPQLRVSADLALSVETDGGRVSEGRLESDGAHLRVVTTDATHMWDAALGSSATGAQVLRHVAARLADSGLRVDVEGADGRVATVGAGVSSRVGRLVTGTDQVSLGGLRAVAPLVRARLAATARRPVVRAAAAGVVLGVLAGARRRRSRLGG